MRLIVHLDAPAGEPLPGEHVLEVEDATPDWLAAVTERCETPGVAVIFPGSLDGGHPQMYAVNTTFIAGMEVAA
jgi:hypothetical protein